MHFATLHEILKQSVKYTILTGTEIDYIHFGAIVHIQLHCVRLRLLLDFKADDL